MVYITTDFVNSRKDSNWSVVLFVEWIIFLEHGHPFSPFLFTWPLSTGEAGVILEIRVLQNLAKLGVGRDGISGFTGEVELHGHNGPEI